MTEAYIWDIGQLIAEVHARRAIWDREDPYHQNRDVVGALWAEISEKMGVSGEAARAKWKHLRDTFRAQMKKCQQKKGGDQWMWYRPLSFLADHMRSRGSALNGDTLDQEDLPNEVKREDDSNGSTSNSTVTPLLQIESSSSLSTLPRSLKRKSTPTIENVFPEIHTWSSEPQNASITQADANYYFFLSLLPQMASIPPTRQMLLRLKIQELVCKEILQNEEQQQQINGDTIS